jgi:hypothetical protein
MRSPTERIEHSSETNVDHSALTEFTRELSELGRKYRIGIAGSPSLFVLEPDDYAYNYDVRDDSSLIFGAKAS